MGVAQDAEFLEQVDADQLIDLHRSNLLRLQTTQLLEQVRWQPSKTALEFRHQVAEFIESLSKKKVPLLPTCETPFPTLSDKPVEEGRLFLPALVCHHQHHYSSPDAYSSTSTNSSSSSMALLCKAGGNAQVPPTLQLHVQISNSFFAPKDYSKHRYFDKRNSVVWTVGRHLNKAAAAKAKSDSSSPPMLVFSSLKQKVFWKYSPASDVRKPILLLLQNKFRLEITFGMQSTEWIPSPLRLVPNRGNLGILHPTPHYNQALLEDVYGTYCATTTTTTTTEATASSTSTMTQAGETSMAAAGILAKIWCLQRGLLRGHDTLTEFQILVLLEFLARTKRIHPRWTPTQILAAWFKLLVETDWSGEASQESSPSSSNNNNDSNNLIRKAPSEAYRDITATTAATKNYKRKAVLVLPLEGHSEQQTIAKSELAQLYAQQTRESPVSEADPPTLLELYQQTTSFSAVLLDPTMSFNHLGRWSPSFVRLLQRQAQKSLDHLYAPAAFDYLFLTEARFWSRYDAYLRVRISDIVVQQQSSSLLWGSDGQDVGEYESMARGLVHVLSMALGDRVHEIRLLTTGNGNIVTVHGTAAQEEASILDTDEIPRWQVAGAKKKETSTANSSKKQQQKPPASPAKMKLQSPTGSDWIVIGFTFNSEACTRIVDRGPPAEDVTATDAFVRLWGSQKAQLRRFKDGAIVHAVVWDALPEDDENVVSSDGIGGGDVAPYIRFENDDKLNGGIAERIVRHIIRLHFLGNPKAPQFLQFSLRGMLSAIDGVLHESDDSVDLQRFNNLTAHRMVIKAYDSLSQFLRKHSLPTEPVPGTSDMASRLGIPLAIDAVEQLSPALRYADVFPPVPHPLLGASSSSAATSKVKEKKIPGAILSNPIEIQIRFGLSSKWPTELRAIGAAKTAMIVRIVEGIDAMKQSGLGGASHFYGNSYVTANYADIGYMGYVFRLRVRAEPELKLLRSLNRPSDEALSLLRAFTKQHVVAFTHHTMVLSVYTSNPSSSAVTRLAQRWISSHLLSGHFPLEAVELIVASVYSSSASPLERPGSVVTGFLRFLQVLGSHDWAREPLIVDPHKSLSSDDVKEITQQFEHIRGSDFQKGPAMFIISPSDCLETGDSKLGSGSRAWYPTFTDSIPETVVLARAAKLAGRSYSFLKQSLRDFESDDWSSAFQESKASFHSYSALLRVSADFVMDPTSSSSTDSDLGVVRVGNSGKLESAFTRTMRCRWKGPKDLELKIYRNISAAGNKDDGKSVILHWNPVDSMAQTLVARLGPYALFFYDNFCPNVIAVLWRPLFEPRAFSAMVCEYARPITADEWKQDTLVTLNVQDLLRAISQYTADIVTDVKVLDRGPAIISQIKRKRKQPPEPSSSSDSDSSSSSSSSSNGDTGRDNATSPPRPPPADPPVAEGGGAESADIPCFDDDDLPLGWQFEPPHCPPFCLPAGSDKIRVDGDLYKWFYKKWILRGWD